MSDLEKFQAMETEFADAAARLESNVKAATGKKRVPVGWGIGKGWFWSHKQGGPDGAITGDKVDYFRHGFDYCDSVLLHEVGHAAISKDLIEEFTQDEWNQPGFAIGVNWIEDNRDENNADNVVNGGKDKIRNHLKVDVQPGQGLDFTLEAGRQGTGVMDFIAGKLDYIPSHMRFGAIIRNYFYEKEIAGTLKTQADLDVFISRVRAVNSDLADKFVQMRPDIERYYKAIPGRFPTKEEVKQKAQEAAAIYRNYFWPEYQRMVDKAYEDHSLKKFIEDLISGKNFQGEEGGQIIVISFDDLPKDIQDEIREKMKPQSVGQPQVGTGLPQAGGEEGGKAEKKPGEEVQAGGGTVAGKEKPSETVARAGKPGEKKEEEEERKREGQAGSPIDKLSDKTKETVKKVWDQVGEKDKQETRGKAAKEMGEVEDEVNKQLQGHTDDPGIARETEVAKNVEKYQPGKGKKREEGEKVGEEPQTGGGKPQEGVGKEQAEAKPEAPKSKGSGKGKGRSEVKQPTRKDFDELNRYRQRQTEAGEPKNIYDACAKRPEIDAAIRFLDSNVNEDPYRKPRYFYAESGGTVDVQRDIEFTMEGGQRFDTQRVEIITEKEEKRKTLLIDLSGSTAQLRELFLSFCVIQTEHSAHQGIENAVCAYTDSGSGFGRGVVRLLKKYEDTQGYGAVVLDRVKEEIGRIADGNFGGGGTPTSAAMLATFEHVILPRHYTDDANAKVRNFLVILTDGQPTDSKSGMTSEETAIHTQRQIYQRAKQENMNLTILCLGIGAGTEFVSNISVPLPPDLQYAIARKLSQIRGKEVDPQKVTTSFKNIEEAIKVWPIIDEFLNLYPEEFENNLESM